MVVPEVTIFMATTQAVASKHQTNIYHYNNTYIVCLEGYTFPDEVKNDVKLVGWIDQKGVYHDSDAASD